MQHWLLVSINSLFGNYLILLKCCFLEDDKVYELQTMVPTKHSPDGKRNTLDITLLEEY